MASPLFRINGGSPGVKASVSASGAVVATLDSTDGVRSTEWFIDTTDDLSEPGDYTLLQSGSVGQTVSTTALTAGTGGKLRARINAGINLATGLPDPEGTNATAIFFVPTSLGREVGIAGEQFESDPTNGSTAKLNAAIRETGGASIADIVGTAPITVTGTTTRTVAITAADGLSAGSMSAVDFNKLGNATAAATAGRFVVRGSSAEAAFGYVEAGASGYASAGTVRMPSGASVQSRVGGANLSLVADNGSGAITVGDATDATALSVLAAGALSVTASNVGSGNGYDVTLTAGNTGSADAAGSVRINAGTTTGGTRGKIVLKVTLQSGSTGSILCNDGTNDFLTINATAAAAAVTSDRDLSVRANALLTLNGGTGGAASSISLTTGDAIALSPNGTEVLKVTSSATKLTGWLLPIAIPYAEAGAALTTETTYETIGEVLFNPANNAGTSLSSSITRTIKFTAILFVSVGGQTVSLNLHNETDAVDVTTLTSTSTTPEKQEVTLTVPGDLPNSEKVYSINLKRTGGTASDPVFCAYRRIEVRFT